MRPDEDPAYGIHEDPIFGAFFGCERCDGQGAIMIAGIDSRWAEEPGLNDREEPCPTCQGFGTVYVEEEC